MDNHLQIHQNLTEIDTRHEDADGCQTDLDIIAALVEFVQVGEDAAFSGGTVRRIGDVLHNFAQTAT